MLNISNPISKVRILLPSQVLTNKSFNMNLYKIEFSHSAPKDRKFGIVCLLLAKNNEDVFYWIASEPIINNIPLFNNWKDYSEATYCKETNSFVDKNGDDIGEFWFDNDINPEYFKERMLRLKGEMNDDDYDYSNVYYGVTLYGWSLIHENIKNDYSELKEAGILFEINS